MGQSIRISASLYLSAQNNYPPMNSDESYCQGNDCSAIEKCKRYAKTPVYVYQDFFVGTPGKDETCNFFIKHEEYVKTNVH